MGLVPAKEPLAIALVPRVLIKFAMFYLVTHNHHS